MKVTGLRRSPGSRRPHRAGLAAFNASTNRGCGKARTNQSSRRSARYSPPVSSFSPRPMSIRDVTTSTTRGGISQATSFIPVATPTAVIAAMVARTTPHSEAMPWANRRRARAATSRRAGSRTRGSRWCQETITLMPGDRARCPRSRPTSGAPRPPTNDAAATSSRSRSRHASQSVVPGRRIRPSSAAVCRSVVDELTAGEALMYRKSCFTGSPGRSYTASANDCPTLGSPGSDDGAG